jgi:hypothetical protein
MGDFSVLLGLFKILLGIGKRLDTYFLLVSAVFLGLVDAAWTTYDQLFVSRETLLLVGIAAILYVIAIIIAFMVRHLGSWTEFALAGTAAAVWLVFGSNTLTFVPYVVGSFVVSGVLYVRGA